MTEPAFRNQNRSQCRLLEASFARMQLLNAARQHTKLQFRISSVLFFSTIPLPSKGPRRQAHGALSGKAKETPLCRIWSGFAPWAISSRLRPPGAPRCPKRFPNGAREPCEPLARPRKWTSPPSPPTTLGERRNGFWSDENTLEMSHRRLPFRFSSFPLFSFIFFSFFFSLLSSS